MEIDGFSDRGQQLFLYALWLSGTPKAKEYLEQKACKATGDAKATILELCETAPPDLRETIPSNGVEEDMSWGAFLATGDPLFVTKIIAAAAENAQQHEIVYRTLEQELTNYRAEKREIIQDIIDKAKLPTGPDILQEEIQQVLEEQKSKGTWLGLLGN
jgi:hypothetical protein